MFWVFIYLILLLLYLVISASKFFSSGFDSQLLIITVSGLIGLSTTTVMLLYRHNLTFYFWWIRFVNWFRNYPAKWKLDIRFDGEFETDTIAEFAKFVISPRFLNHAKIHHKTKNSINFTIHETINFYLDYQLGEFTSIGHDCIDISMTPFEIGSNDSKRKLNSEIIPILQKLQEFFRPAKVSYVLSVQFLKSNPFYAVYLAHLKPSQINSFTVNLIVDHYTAGKETDQVTISKDNLYLNANNVHSLKELAKDFIYLSPNVKSLIKG